MLPMRFAASLSHWIFGASSALTSSVISRSPGVAGAPAGKGPMLMTFTLCRIRRANDDLHVADEIRRVLEPFDLWSILGIDFKRDQPVTRSRRGAGWEGPDVDDLYIMQDTASERRPPCCR